VRVAGWYSTMGGDHAEDAHDPVRPLFEPLDLDALVVELLVKRREGGPHPVVAAAHTPVDRVLGVDQGHVGVKALHRRVHVAAGVRRVEIAEALDQGGVHRRSLV
jgi:hypothetical protein